MRALIVMALALPLLLAIFLGWSSLDPVQVERRQDRAYYRTELERLDLARQRAEQQAALAWVEARRAAWSSGEIALVAAFTAGLTAALFLALWGWRERQLLVWPRASDGALPVPYRDAASGQLTQIAAHLLELRKLVELGAAQRPNVPQVLTYSPHASLELETNAGRAPLLPGDPESAGSDDAAPGDPPPAPPFGELLRHGMFGPGRLLLYGYADGQPVTGQMTGLYATGIGGGAGSGKTSAILFYGAQAALAGVELLVIDPHGAADSSLASRIAPLAPAMREEPGVEPREIMARIKYVWAAFQDRKRRGAEDERPVLVLIDEWTSLLRGDHAAKLVQVLGTLAIEGRKYKVFVALAAHRWSVEAAGGADVRNMLVSHILCKNRLEEARMQTGLRSIDLPAHPLALAPGRTIFVPNGGAPQLLALPMLTEADMLDVGRRLPRQASTEAYAPAGAASVPADAQTQAHSTQAQAGAGMGADAGAPLPSIPVCAAAPSTRIGVSAGGQYAQARAGMPHCDADTTYAADAHPAPGIPASIPVWAEDHTGIPPAHTGAEAGIPVWAQAHTGAEVDEQEGGVTPEAVRTLAAAGWSKNRIAGLLTGAKQRRLDFINRALDEGSDDAVG